MVPLRPSLSPSARYVLQHPFEFLRSVLLGFRRNQCVIQAGAIAYYALLSLVPMLILAVIALSHFVSEADLLAAAGRYLEWLVPSQSKSLLADVSGFLANGITIGAVLLLTMLFFSSLAFSVVEKAMSVIFMHRREVQTRHALVSAILPYCFVLALGIGLLVVSGIALALQTLAQESIHVWGHDWSLNGVSGVMLYLLGVGTEALLFTAMYLVMPVGRTRLIHALIGGVTATLMWETLRHGFVWYFTTLSKASVVYGSLTTAVVALFTLEVAALLLLFGAQVIAEYEQLATKSSPG